MVKLKIQKGVISVAAGLLLFPFLTGCFTGVEGTSRINLSKKDIMATAPTEEDLYLAEISPLYLKDWQPGKKFLIADGKFRMLLEGEGNGKIETGDTVSFVSYFSRPGAGGKNETVIVFDAAGAEMRYGVDRPAEAASVSFSSSDIPMLIDIDMVERVGVKLIGKVLYTRTSLWYDASGHYKKGKKYVAVRVNDIKPGNAFFPISVNFTDVASGESGTLLMNVGSSGNESRNFGRLFSLKDPRSVYRHISDENWNAIQSGKVRTGMTKEEVKLSLGNPSDVDTGHNYSNAMEIWYYPDGSYLRFVDGLLVGR